MPRVCAGGASVRAEDAFSAVSPDGGRDSAAVAVFGNAHAFRGEEDAVHPLGNEACRVFVESGRVAVIGGVLRVFEAFDLGMGEQDDHHAAFVPEIVEEREDFAPVDEGVHIAFAIPSIGLLN